MDCTQPAFSAPAPSGRTFSKLVLSDRLISLAQDADRAGLRHSAGKLVGLAYSVLDDEGAASPSS